MQKKFSSVMDVKANPIEKKTYTLDKIKKLAPGYKGKAEKFDPAKAGKKKQPPTRSKLGPKSPTRIGDRR